MHCSLPDQSARWITLGRMGMFATGKSNILDTDLLLRKPMVRGRFTVIAL
jgi:hypothetical protein